MAEPRTPRQKQEVQSLLSESFKQKIQHFPIQEEVQNDIQRIMLALGYAIALTPTGSTAFTRQTEHKAIDVRVWVMNEQQNGCPSSLLESVWVGYYTHGDQREMVEDFEYPRLMDYLQEHHPEIFS
ncbi:hypothetical protein [Halodesulfovibrio marinisediminis]|uniref:Uncharacterized protein n=1 Tax=Halodesulfovibrio marinisediminis DSM 17456 TaxID=1121457 RepID=A0A1N6EZV6_9BACT|nr:hypothetical protein [Halodesulfovibrio marinisediminis]SIN88519.1 hypothetical protein SAMN02745161_1010 [Halodesulfovibrio marinisediminis DSM 17456]